MGIVGWLLLVAAGIALGFGVGRFWPGSAAKLSALEQERDAAREELETYREEVSTHFAQTAQLFDKVTADYRGLYEHLAMGSRQLGALRGESVELPQARPEERRLAMTEPDLPIGEAGPPISEPPIAASPAPADDVSGTETPPSNIPPTDAPAEPWIDAPEEPQIDAPEEPQIDAPEEPRIDEPATAARDDEEQPDRRAVQDR